MHLRWQDELDSILHVLCVCVGEGASDQLIRPRHRLLKRTRKAHTGGGAKRRTAHTHPWHSTTVLPTTSASVTANGSDIAVAENATATRLCTPQVA